MTVETAPNSLKMLPWASALAQMAEIGHPTISWTVPVAGKWPNVRGWRMLRQTVGSLWGMWSTLSRSGCPGFSDVPLQQEMYLFFLCGTDILGKSKLWPLWSCKLVQNKKREWFSCKQSRPKPVHQCCCVQLYFRDCTGFLHMCPWNTVSRQEVLGEGQIQSTLL